MGLLLVLAFIVVPILELYVIIEVGSAIGVMPTIGLLILDSLIGAALLRSQGRAVWNRFNLALAEGRVPGREVFDGGLVIFGGALLLTPGFITDVFGLTLLFPPTRAVVRSGLARALRRRIIGGRVIFRRRGPAPPPGWGPPPGQGRRPGSPYDYEGSAREVPDAELPPRTGGAESGGDGRS